VRARWVSGVAEHVHNLARGWRVRGEPSGDDVCGRSGAGQEKAGDIVADGSLTRRRLPNFHRYPQLGAIADRELYDDLVCRLILRSAIVAERGVDHMRAGQDLSGADEHAHPDGAPVRVQHAYGTTVRGIRHP
jgi:hypothetical protein